MDLLRRWWRGADEEELDGAVRPAAGKTSLTARLPASAEPFDRGADDHPVAFLGSIQREAVAAPLDDPFAVHLLARDGVAGAGGPLPHGALIQHSFGHHDVGGVRAHVGGAAADAAGAIGARAYATGDDVAFAAAPDLRQAAHEAAHVVQQRGGVRLDGGVGRSGDPYETHADAVADLVVRGESAEGLLDTMAHRGAAGGAAVQRWSWRDSDRAARPVEARQTWDSSAFDGLRGGADAEGDAVRGNAALGFTPDKVISLRFALGIRARQPLIDRDFAAAVAAHRGAAAPAVAAPEGAAVEGADTAVAAPAPEGAAVEGADTAAAVADPGTAGILDEALVFALDPGSTGHLAGIAGARRGYTTEALWATATAAEITAIAAAVAAPLRVAADELTPRAAGGATATALFCRQVANWQMWHRREVASVDWGHLSAADLGDLGAPVPAGATSVAPVVGEPAAEGAAPVVADPAVAAEPVAPAEPVRDAQGLTADERQELEGHRRSLQALLGRRRSASRSGDTERVATLETEIDAMVRTVKARLIALERPNLDFSAVDQYEQISARGNWMVQELRSQLGATIAGHGGPAPADPAAPGEPVRAATGPERVAPGVARRALEAGHFITDADPELAYREFDGRVLGGSASDGASPEAVEARLVTITAGFNEAIGLLRHNIDELNDAGATLRAVMTRLCGLRYTEVPRLRHAPVPIRLPWDARQAEVIARETEAQLRTRMGRWVGRSGLAGQISHLENIRDAQADYGEMIAESREHGGGVLAGNEAAVQVDLNRTGVSILWGSGTPVPIREMTLDPQFADAMVRFLGELSSHGVTHLWTAGFLRDVISPLDTHPQGKAVDITAFQFGEHVLHLRNGRPGESAWFNHTDRIEGRTYEEVLHAITARMPSYFSRIVGPGNDGGHMGHWHVELTGASEATPIHAIRDDADMPTDVTDRADARVPDWRTGAAPPPVAE